MRQAEQLFFVHATHMPVIDNREFQTQISCFKLFRPSFASIGVWKSFEFLETEATIVEKTRIRDSS
jgi:hypothetical protein